LIRPYFTSGRVARLDSGVPAHDPLRLMVVTYEGRKPVASWRRPPGRPHNVWLNKFQENANAVLLSTLWRSEIARGSRCGVAFYSDYATTTMMMMIFQRVITRSLLIRIKNLSLDDIVRMCMRQTSRRSCVMATRC